MNALTLAKDPDPLAPALSFLGCRTPDSWLKRAVCDLDSLLLDHASLELKAAQQAQKLIWKYGAGGAELNLNREFRGRLTAKMSRLAREELRHFEQVLDIIERRGGSFRAISASRYAAGLHELSAATEPGSLVDSLIIGAIIEARSCERFGRLEDALDGTDDNLSRFYGSLLRSEARHFEDYLALARDAGGVEPNGRIAIFLERDRELIESRDIELRFLSGVPSDQPTDMTSA